MQGPGNTPPHPGAAADALPVHPTYWWFYWRASNQGWYLDWGISLLIARGVSASWVGTWKTSEVPSLLQGGRRRLSIHLTTPGVIHENPLSGPCCLSHQVTPLRTARLSGQRANGQGSGGTTSSMLASALSCYSSAPWQEQILIEFMQITVLPWK